MSNEIVPIFSGGVGRSGTTIVARILRNHSQVFGGSPNEIKFLTETYGLIDLVFGMRNFVPSQTRRDSYLLSKLPLNRSSILRYRMFRRRILKDWWRRTNRLGVESGIHRSMSRKSLVALLDKLEAEMNQDLKLAGRNFFIGFVQNHRKYEGQKYWIDTTTSNIMYADYLFKFLPEARFIEMRRHPLDNLSSVLLEPWGPSNLRTALPWFRDRLALQDLASTKLPKSQFARIWLEDLVKRERENSYERLLEVVGVDDQPRMRKYFEEEVTVERAHLGRWRTSFENPNKVRREFELTVGEIDDSLIDD